MPNEPLRFTTSQIAASLPGSRGAPRVHPATVTRWILVGCRARDGSRVKLAATRVGSRWLVSQADLDRFFASLGADVTSPPNPPLPPAKDVGNSATNAARALQRTGA